MPDAGPSLLLSEIAEQPAVLARLLDRERDRAFAVAARLAPREFRLVLVAARGTSDNAARYAQYLLGARNGLTVALAAPSLFGVYRGRFGPPPRLSDALVLGISQSGQSPDIVAVLDEARRQGAATLAVTNDPQSPLAAAADEVFALHAGAERSVAATKTYTAQLLALALLSVGLRGSEEDRTALQGVPAAVAAALDQDEAPLRAAAARLAPSARCAVVGRGFHLATAHELALKVKELARVEAEPFSAADFEHGPIALAEPGFRVIVVEAGEAVVTGVRELAARLRAAGAVVVPLADSAVPPGMPEWLGPIPAIVPGQRLAHALALARGADPDHPRTIRKVTRTT